ANRAATADVVTKVDRALRAGASEQNAIHLGHGFLNGSPRLVRKPPVRRYGAGTWTGNARHLGRDRQAEVRERLRATAAVECVTDRDGRDDFVRRNSERYRLALRRRTDPLHGVTHLGR